MRIGFDAKRAFFNTSGLGNYSRRLMQGLATYCPEHQYIFYVPTKIDVTTIAKDAMPLINFPNAQLHFPNAMYNKLLGSQLWRSVGILKNIEKDNLDIYHGLSHELPIGIQRKRTKSIVTIHDLIFLRYPKLYNFLDRWVYQKKWAYSCRIADKIIATSEQTKQDLVDFMQVKPEKIVTVYQTCHPRFYDYGDELFLQHGLFVQQTYDIPYNIPQDYILYVGSIIERKNLLNLVKALEQLKNRLEVHLVVVGKGKEYLQKVQTYIVEHHLEKQVTFLSNVASEHLPALYRCAKAFVYPSIFEGFGIPILEALFSRVPVLTTQGGCFQEVGGEHTYYVDPMDIEALSNGIEQLLTNGALRMDMIVNGWNHAQKFREEKATANVMEVYKSVF